MASHEEDSGVSRAVTEGANAEAWTETSAEVMLRREVRLEERAGEECMAIEAGLVVYYHD